jgi:DNA invertase Pin-like site-specific DNA recombinase
VTADAGIVWGAYARLSRKKPNRRKGGRQRGRVRDPNESVERQLALIHAYATEHGLALDEELVFSDNGRSGWQKPGGPPPHRPQWDAMIAAGKAGRFGGLLTWKIDRFTRNPRDGEDLADLGLLLDGPASGRIDLRTAAGLSTFRKQVEAAAYGSHETQEKVRAAQADMLARGYRIGGSGRLFGFEVLSEAEYAWDAWDGDGPAAIVREDEAVIVRDLAVRLLRGDTLDAMAAWLNGNGITTTRGGAWAPSNLSRTLGNPLYGGELAYKQKIVGRLANVEPILDAGTYEAVQAKLTGRKKGPRPAGRYPLSGVAVCGNPACARQSKMAGSQRTGGQRAYTCPIPGKVRGCGQSVLAAPVEGMVRDRVLVLLADVEAREAMRAADTALDEQRAKLHAELRDLDADMAENEAKLGRLRAGQRRDAVQANLRSQEAREAEVLRLLDELGPAAAIAPPLPVMTAEDWEAPTTTVARKAAVIRRLGLHITIRPPTRAQGASRLPFDTGRVQIEP